MTVAEVIAHLQDGWMLVVERESKTNAAGDMDCLGINALSLSKDGETDIRLPASIFDELSPRLSAPEHEHGCIFIHTLAK